MAYIPKSHSGELLCCHSLATPASSSFYACLRAFRWGWLSEVLRVPLEASRLCYVAEGLQVKPGQSHTSRSARSTFHALRTGRQQSPIPGQARAAELKSFPT